MSRLGHIDRAAAAGRISRACLCLAVVTLSTACGAGNSSTSKGLPPISWQGEHISFFTTVGRLPCGDSLEFMDRRVAELAADLGQSLDPDERISYYWLPGRMDLSPCPEGADCSEGTKVFSRTMFHDHELVHVILRDLGRSQTFLYEGLAEAFGRAGGALTVERGVVRAEVLRSLFAEVDPAAIDYPLAGLFVRFLVETYGIDAVERVYARSRYDTRIGQLRSIFEDELGAPMDDVLDDFVQEAPDCYPRSNLCSGEPVPFHEGVWSRRLGLACASAGVLEIAPGALRNDTVLEIAESGEYLVTVSESSTPVEPVVVIGCTCRAEVHPIDPGGESILELERGFYRVVAGRVAREVDVEIDPVEVTIRARPPEVPNGASRVEARRE